MKLSASLQRQHIILHLSVLFAFALAQPLFDLLSRNAEFLAVRQARPLDIILITLLLVLAGPIITAITLWLATGLHSRFKIICASGLFALLMALIFLPPLNNLIILNHWTALAISLCIGAVFAFHYWRNPVVRMFLTMLVPSIILFPLLFLFNSPVYSLVDQTETLPTASVSVSSEVPVVVVIFDELPLATLTDDAGKLDRLLFPHFAALAEHSIWYRNASTVADYTTHAVPAILTGQYPRVADRPGRKTPKASFTEWFGMPTARSHPDNLFTLLGNDYRLEVHETVTSLCAEILCGTKTDAPRLAERISALVSDLSVVYAHLVTPPDLATHLPSVTLGWSGFLADHGVEKADDTQDFQRFVESIDSNTTPTLYFHHATLPHSPWVYLPSGEKHQESKLSFISVKHWGTDEAVINHNYLQHLRQTRYADQLLGTLLKKLRDTGLYDRALIAVTADHGASFKAGTSFRAVGKDNYHDILSIPLIIKLPHQSKAKIDDRAAQTIDILPTIAAILGINLPFPVDGQSLLGQPADPEKPRTVIDKKGRILTFDFHYRNLSEVRKRKSRLVQNQ